jgi:predicted TIM-barrel fold metal-dependent hydrolase
MAARIDAHLHLSCDGEAGLRLLADLDLKLLNISVPQPDREKWRARTNRFRSLAERHPDRFAWVAGFDLPTWDADGNLEVDYAERVIAGLEENLTAGAVGVKIWKNVGMEVVKPSGEYLMVDDPLYDPIYDYLEAKATTLLLHIGEPLACWLPLDDPDNPHYGYYSKNPQWHMYGRQDKPSYQHIIDARDRMVAGHPRLRVVGAHLGSLEYDVDAIAQRFDEFSNFAVDTSARLLDLASQDTAKVRAFVECYHDRILFGTDIVDDTPWSTLADDEVAEKAARTRERIMQELAWYGQDGDLRIRDRQTTGLGLPADALEDVVRRNAERWYPGL